MGWGSMQAGTPDQMATLAIEAAQSAGTRVVVLGGWAGLSAEALPTDELRSFAAESAFFCQGDVPHEWLFPQCSAAVIHGGAGTCAAVLKSAIPLIVTPVLGNDQFYWAGRVNALGLGKGFRKQLLRINAAELSAAIIMVTTSALVQSKVNEMAATLRQEDGVEVATGIITALAKKNTQRSHT